MTRRILLVLSVVSVLLFAMINFVYAQDAGPQAAEATALGTVFTYQGQLKSGGAGVTGTCEMVFRLYDAVTAGNPIGLPITQAVTVNAGLFTTQLDFGASIFNGQARWLEMAVKCASDADFTALSRQAVTATPYAVYAQSVNTATVQSRVTGGCGAGFAVRQVNADGSVTCEPITGGGAHDHWGASWIGTGTGLTLSSTNGIGVIGATASMTTNGVNGLNTAGSGGGSGVFGQSASGDGRGVSGDNPSLTGQSYGVYGQAASTSGRGVAGMATATTGTAYGVYGQADSTAGRGVYGNASAASGSTYGVYGRSVSTDGAGVYGIASATTGSTYGVYATAASTGGRGIYADASAATGTTYGVYGHVSSPAGWAGYFTTIAGNGVYINAPSGTGLNVANGAALIAGNPIWHAGNDGPDSGLNADLLDGQHGSYYLDASNIQAGTLSTGNYSAYSDLSAEGYLGNASGDLALNNGTLNTNLNADLLDGYSAGNANGNVPVNNSTLNSNLNADLLDGLSASAFAASAHSHDHGALTGLTDDDHTQYFNLSQNEAVTGIPAFNGGTSGVTAPFSVDSTAWVSNLNADFLDGQNASAFATSAHNHWGESWSGTGTGLTLSGGTTGLSSSGSSYGVLGQTSGASGYKAGVRGETTSTGGWGVAGVATAASGTTYGVGGVSDSTAGTGVYGSASAASGTTYGVYGTAASPFGVGVYGVAAATSFGAVGVYGKSNAGSGFGGYFESAGSGVGVESELNGVAVISAGIDGVHVASAGGDGVDAAGNLYAGYFRGNISVDGACTGCLLAVFGINASDRSIQPGEVVAIQGLQASTLDNAQSLWKVTPATGNGVVVGVVRGRAELDVATEGQELRMGETGERLVPREGEVKPGEYLTIVIYGPMQVRAGTSGTIAAGTRLAVGATGQARPLQTVVVNGVTLAENAPLIGTALDAVDKTGLVWVLVNPR